MKETGMENTISLEIFWKIFKKSWIILIAAAVVAVIVVGVVYNSFFYSPVYSSHSKFYVSNVADNTSIYSSGQTAGANQMAENCKEFVSGSVVLNDVLNQAQLSEEQRQSLSAAKLSRMITAKTSGNALVSVTVSGPDAELNFRIAEAVEKVLPKRFDDFNNQIVTGEVPEGESKLLKITDKCQIDGTPDNASSRYIYPALAGILVFVGLYCLFVVLYLTNRTIYSSEDIKDKLPGISVFGEIPHWTFGKDASKNNSPVGKAGTRKKDMELRLNVAQKRIDRDGTPFYISEAFRRLCTNVTFCSGGQKGCTIGVLSCHAASGKSFTMANLALSLSNLIDKKVLLVDGDMRHPMQQRVFEVENKCGLSNLLAGQVKDESEVIRVLNNGSLHLITAGSIPPNPMELLSSSHMAELLEAWKQEYDYILFDLPPVGTVADALVLSQLVNGFLFVLRSGMDDSKLVQETADQVSEQEGKILGYVLTDIADENMRGSYYYKYYGKKGKYGYGYGDPTEETPKTEK